MDRPITTLFLLMSVDGKMSTGATDELDVDRDFPNLPGVREGLHQYYEIEQTTDLWSLNSGRVQAKIGANTAADIEIEMTAKADLAQKPYVLDVNMKYDAGTMFDLTDKASVSIPISQESRFDTSIPEVVPADITVGSQSNVMFSIYNTGKTTLYNVQVKFKADSIDEASSFVGNLQSGATGSVDVMLTGIAATMDDGTVTMEISYEDDAGKVTTEEKTITLFVTEMIMDDMMGDDMMGEDFMVDGEGGPKKGWSVGVIVGIVVSVLVAFGVVGLIIFLQIRKKKKAAALLADELSDLEAELGNEKDSSPYDNE